MITINWKGKIGYGDIISPLCYAHNIAQKNCDNVTLHMHWMHKRGEKFKPEDVDTLDTKFKYLWSICKPIPYHNVYLKQSFNKNLDYNHDNYDDESSFHNLWFARVKNLNISKPYVVMNTTATHKQQFEEYDPGKQWKDPVGLEKWRHIENTIQTKWGMDVVHCDYTDGIADAVDKSLKYKEQKKVDAEIGTDKDKDKDAAGPKGFKISPDTTVVSGYRDPGFTLAGQKGRSFGGLIGTLGGAAIGLANPAIGAAMGSSIGGRVGSYFD